MSAQEAVFILQGQDIADVYWLSDLEQMVRQRTALRQPLSGRVKAAYVALDRHNSAEALVLFELPLTAGVIDAGWHMPLKRLAENGGEGPSLGGSRVRLACRSQCSISWHADSLWEPVTSDFMAIRKALRDKRLPQQVDRTESPLWPVNPINTAGRISGDVGWALARRHDDPEVEELKRTLRQEMEAYRKQLQQLQQDMARQQELNSRLERQLQDSPLTGLEASVAELTLQLAARDEEISGLRHALAEASGQRQQQAEQLAEVQHERDERVPAAALQALQLEHEQLKQTLEDEAANSGDRLIQVLEDQDAVVVAFHPGAGHLTITPANIRAYTSAPLAYAAGKCGVDEALYRQWLEHHDKPCCLQCGTAVPRIAHPREFSQDLNAYCKLHRRIHLSGETDSAD